jgi:hypothetical protein
MGQLALGLRSLVIKLAIFFALAALLAWVLGGSLFPRTPSVELDSVSFLEAEWQWKLMLRQPGDQLRWELVRREADGSVEVVDAGPWREVAGPVAAGEFLVYAGRPVVGEDRWRLARVDRGMRCEWSTLPDRLAVERQLERVRQGLPLQPAAEVERLRPLVLEPQPEDGA